MKNKKKFMSVIVIFIVVIVIIKFFASKEYRIMDSKAFENLLAQELLALECSKFTPGYFWNRNVNVKITNIRVKLLKNRRIRITDCVFAIVWQEGMVPVRWNPVFSGEANLIQDGSRLFVQDIFLSKTDVLTNNYNINAKVTELVNHLLQKKQFVVYQDKKLSIVKVRTDEEGVYAKVNW